MQNWEALFRKRVLESFEGKEFDPAHDISHYERVVATAKKLALEEKAKLEVVVPAAWLHDLANVAKNDPRRQQASRISAQLAIQLLGEVNYPGEHLNGITHAIEAHSFSAKIEAISIEAKVVQDADRLDALGAIGVARLFATSVVFKSAFYESVDPFSKNGRIRDDSRFAVDHFWLKLFKIGETLSTKAGRQEAKRRVRFMQLFLDQLGEEIGPTNSTVISASS